MKPQLWAFQKTCERHILGSFPDQIVSRTESERHIAAFLEYLVFVGELFVAIETPFALAIIRANMISSVRALSSFKVFYCPSRLTLLFKHELISERLVDSEEVKK